MFLHFANSNLLYIEHLQVYTVLLHCNWSGIDADIADFIC